LIAYKFITILLLLAVNLCTYASSSLKLTTKTPTQLDLSQFESPMSETQLAALYQRFDRHYGDFIGPNPKRQADFDFFMEEQSSFESFILYEAYQRAMEEGLAVDQLNHFGIVQLGNGQYEIDYASAPHLNNIKGLFDLILMPRDAQEHYLRGRGFRQIDYDIIEQYVAANDLYDMLQSNLMTYYSTVLPELKQSLAHIRLLSPEFLNLKASQFSYIKAYIRYRTTRNWAVGLLNKLDNQRRRILKHTLIERIHNNPSKHLSGSSNGYKNRGKNFLEAIVSGHLENKVKSFQRVSKKD